MNAKQVRLVQESWERVAPISLAAGSMFYRRLFELDPSLRMLFVNTSMSEQHEKLMQTITIVVRGLDQMDALLPSIKELGLRHAGYGVKESHYETVGEALMWTLQQALGDAFTDEVRDSWLEAYRDLASIMIRAAA
jgi:hemoglobin-like flavoprotein